MNEILNPSSDFIKELSSQLQKSTKNPNNCMYDLLNDLIVFRHFKKNKNQTTTKINVKPNQSIDPTKEEETKQKKNITTTKKRKK